MIDDFASKRDVGEGPAVDSRVFSSLLKMAGEDVQDDLLEQLRSDLRRLDAALTATDPDEICRATHEAKGLAATIGADRLAQLAQNLNALAPRLGVGGLSAMAASVQVEIGAVLAILDSPAGQNGPA